MVSLLAILLAVAACPLDATPEDYEGKTVAAIHFQPQAQPLSATETNRITGQLAGRPFTRAAVRDMILQLYATGRYDDLEVDAALDNGQVILTVRTRQNWFISRVAVEGVEEPPNREQLVNATRLELGALYSGESLVEAIRGLEEALRGNGYYHPRIQPLVERYPNYDEMHILFLVHPGPRAYFARPVLAGNLKLSESRIVRATHWKRWWGLLGWQKLTESRLQQAVERVRQTYQKNDFLLARVSLTNLDFDPDLNRATPALQIEAGPKVRVTASGAKLSGGRLKELVPVYQEQSVDQDLLIEGRRKMENHFQSKGHFDAQVSFDRKNISAAEQAIEYSVDLGGRYRVAHVAISGNAYFDVFTIRERMSILSAGRVYNRNGRFSEDLLGRDKAAIEELYNGSGFRDVRVESRVEKNYRGHPRDVAVYLDVKEGEQWFVNSLELSGVDLRLYPAVKAILTSTEGQPYSTLTMSADRDNILNLYFDNGYPDATLEILSTPSAIPRRMDVKYVVTEGRRLFVRDVQVNGLKSTRPGLVRTRITLVPDEPLSYSSMVFSQRRLYDLGIFAKVDMGLQNPGGSTREKRVLYQMEDASRY
ncbi:MAG: hypothetical protein HY235_07575 [Acidobacteria bacterium]|nr:hypothetical protein [Acidobacteriota bacterium]